MSLWTLGMSGRPTCLGVDSKCSLQHQHTGNLVSIPRPRRLLVQSSHPSENVRVSLAVPSVSVSATHSTQQHSTLAPVKPAAEGSPESGEDHTVQHRQQDTECRRQQGATQPATAQHKSGSDRKHRRRDAAGYAVLSQEQKPAPESKGATTVKQPPVMGGNVSNVDRDTEAGHDVKRVSTDSATSSDGESVKYAQEKVRVSDELLILSSPPELPTFTIQTMSRMDGSQKGGRKPFCC